MDTSSIPPPSEPGYNVDDWPKSRHPWHLVHDGKELQSQNSYPTIVTTRPRYSTVYVSGMSVEQNYTPSVVNH